MRSSGNRRPPHKIADVFVQKNINVIKEILVKAKLKIQHTATVPAIKCAIM